MNLQIEECSQAGVLMRAYIEDRLAADERAAMEDHLRGCAACRERLQRQTAYIRLMAEAYEGRRVPPRFKTPEAGIIRETRFAGLAEAAAADVEAGESDEKILSELEEERPPEPPPLEPDEEATWQERLGSAPWWIISGVFHGLLLLLLGLLSMIVLRDASQETVITTDLTKARPPEFDEKKPRDVFRNLVPAPTETPSEVEHPVVPHEKVEDVSHNETEDNMDSRTARGDPNAISDLPLGGLGTSAALGLGGGGAGCYGQRSGGGKKRALAAGGGGKATESAVEAALRWLARHQEKEGYWDADKYLDNKAVRWGGEIGMFSRFDTGVTGLAALAFLGAGHSLKAGQYRKNVQNAIAWLIAQQGPDGDFTAKVKPCHSLVTYYCHCIATLACAEALAMNGGRDWMDTGEGGNGAGLREAVTKGVELILRWQAANKSGGWTYYPPFEVTDATVSGWAIMALKSAKLAGIQVPLDSFVKASDAVLKCTVIEKDKGSYGMAHTGYLRANNHMFNSRGYAITAAAAVIQQFCGADREKYGIDAAVEFITQPDSLPAYIFKPHDANTDHQNYYYWYYGALACFQAGGDPWKRWNEKMKEALIPNQRKGGPLDGSPQDVDGSWDPDDVWGAWGGRVYSTALGALCLEVYYRYLPIYR
ncbi:MAG: zf-HC2 domain-containing protein [Planctomycetota bacterium]|nr:zf-HC2 domain-containing protein [Planctomycetota bacterium]